MCTAPAQAPPQDRHQYVATPLIGVYFTGCDVRSNRTGLDYTLARFRSRPDFTEKLTAGPALSLRRRRHKIDTTVATPLIQVVCNSCDVRGYRAITRLHLLPGLSTA